MRIRRGQKGFTLIELMIVVAIIGILAAIAIPNFISFKKKAILSTAIANLETLRSSMSQYAADRDDGCYPDSLTWGAGVDGTQTVLGNYGLTFPTSMAGVKWSAFTYTFGGAGVTCILYTAEVTAADNETVLKALPQGTCCSDSASNPTTNCLNYAKNTALCSQFGAGL